MKFWIDVHFQIRDRHHLSNTVAQCFEEDVFCECKMVGNNIKLTQDLQFQQIEQNMSGHETNKINLKLASHGLAKLKD